MPPGSFTRSGDGERLLAFDTSEQSATPAQSGGPKGGYHEIVISLIAGILLAVPAGQAYAAPVDCEAARCTVQATIDAECPCAEAKNHGRHTSCVARVVNRLAREGTIPKKCRNTINGCAIRSTCGKKDGTVAGDFPGDGVLRSLSSVGLRLHVVRARGGSVVESCCDSCNAPVPTSTPEEPVATATPGRAGSNVDARRARRDGNRRSGGHRNARGAGRDRNRRRRGDRDAGRPCRDADRRRGGDRDAGGPSGHSDA